MKAKGRYRIFSNHPTDKILMSVDGETIVSYGTLLASSEAGAATYEERRQAYDATKHR